MNMEIYSNGIKYYTLHRQAGKASLCEREFARANVDGSRAARASRLVIAPVTLYILLNLSRIFKQSYLWFWLEFFEAVKYIR